jgi:hypothetical protein
MATMKCLPVAKHLADESKKSEIQEKFYNTDHTRKTTVVDL